jgi:hypothetical protein
MTHTGRMIVIATAMVIGGAAASPAFAADNAMKVCGAKYQAARTAKSIPATETWNQYLAQCRAGMAKPAAVTAPAKPAPAVAARPARVVTPAKPATTPGQPTAAQAAMYARERQCGAQWKADKAAKKVSASETWPQYWSACNKRMK